jgi:pimeloyl-ACP methyl ester carboxylesterase
MGAIHRLVQANGVRHHVVIEGEGPLVILVHGFPESWYSWRYQLSALAEAGYQAAAIDVRGYGRSYKPRDVSGYRMVKHVGDVVDLVGALGAQSAVLVGHDWGAPIVWNSALLRPDQFDGVVGLSVPYSAPRTLVGPSPVEAMRANEDSDEFYISYFQEVGRAEAEIEQDVRQWLLGFYHCASADVTNGPNIARVDYGKELRDKFVYPDVMPGWLSEADLDYYAGEFERSGFFGGLSRYRNVDRDWEDLAAYADQPITIPSMFVGGSKDGPTIWGGAAIARFPETLLALYKSEVIEGSGHWIQQERAEEINTLLIEFLNQLELRR